MKRVFIALTVLALIIAGSVASFINLNYFINDTRAEISYIKENIGRAPTDELINLTDELIANWKEREKIMGLYINRFIIDDITCTVVTLPSFLLAGDVGEYMAGIMQAEEMVEDLHYYHMPSLRNML